MPQVGLRVSSYVPRPRPRRPAPLAPNSPPDPNSGRLRIRRSRIPGLESPHVPALRRRPPTGPRPAVADDRPRDPPLLHAGHRLRHLPADTADPRHAGGTRRRPRHHRRAQPRARRVGAGRRRGPRARPSGSWAQNEDEGERDEGVRFVGAPLGYEFTSLLDAILLVSKRESGLSDASLEMLKQVTQPDGHPGVHHPHLTALPPGREPGAPDGPRQPAHHRHRRRRRRVPGPRAALQRARRAEDGRGRPGGDHGRPARRPRSCRRRCR